MAGYNHHDHASDDGHDHAHEDHSHEHETGHGHAGHSHAPVIGSRNETVVLLVLALTALFMVVEFGGGLVSGSLALLADAGHMLIDTVALGLAWAGFRFGRRASDGLRTFGYMRFEVVAGFINALTLIVLTGWIAFEAITRLMHPEPVLAGPMFWVALAGLAVNIVSFFILQSGDREHVNIRAALLHVVGDLLGSVAAIAAAVIIYFTGWTLADPILSLLLSVLVLRAAWSLLKGSLHILMEGTPGNVVIDELKSGLVRAVPGLAGVAHVHVWSITSGRPAATLEIQLAPAADAPSVTAAVKEYLRESYAIGHATVEIDWGNAAPSCRLDSAEDEAETAVP